MSASIGGRSGNRGDCAQPCRNIFDLEDAEGNIIMKGMHPLSLKDLNLSGYIEGLVDAGIDSLKIEGRLKDINYVKNITALYRKNLDEVLEGRENLRAASSGKVYYDFSPDPEKTFNRGYTEYFIDGRKGTVSSFNSPKSAGKRIGTVEKVEDLFFTVKSAEKINNGDGLFFYDRGGNTTGIKVNRAEGNKIIPQSMNGIFKGAEVFRNYDSAFEKILGSSRTERKISVVVNFYETETGFGITLKDEDGFTASSMMDSAKELSRSGSREDYIKKQAGKFGGTVFEAADIIIESGDKYSIQSRFINELRRSAVEALLKERIKNHRIESAPVNKESIVYPYKKIDYTWNVTNRLAEKFYRRHGVEHIDPGFDISHVKDSQVMTTAMCLKHELDLCTKDKPAGKKWKEPFFIANGRDRFRVEFDCSSCMMKIFTV
jgi:putative protease